MKSYSVVYGYLQTLIYTPNFELITVCLFTVSNLFADSPTELNRLLGNLRLFLNSLKSMVSHEAIILFEKEKQKRFGQRTWEIMVAKTNENERNHNYENKYSFSVSVYSHYWIHLYILKWEWNDYSIYYIMNSIHVLNARSYSYVHMFWTDVLLLFKFSVKITWNRVFKERNWQKRRFF